MPLAAPKGAAAHMLRIVRMHATTSFIFLLVLLPSSLARVGNRDNASATKILLLPSTAHPKPA
jgi:hypothetical protein